MVGSVLMQRMLEENDFAVIKPTFFSTSNAGGTAPAVPGHTGLTLREGMVFTIEPMLNQGTHAVDTEADGWTVVTRDGRLSAQFEHTVAVTRDGVRVLTLRPGEQPPR